MRRKRKTRQGRTFHQIFQYIHLTDQIGPGRHDERCYTRHVRTGHTCAVPGSVPVTVRIVVGTDAGVHVVSRSRDVRFFAVAEHRDRPAAAETGKVVTAVGGAYGKTAGENGGRIVHGVATRAIVSSGGDHENTRRPHVVDDGIHCGKIGAVATLRSRTTPGVVDDVRGHSRVGVGIVQIGGHGQPLETFDVGGRCAVVFFHVAAADPFGAGRHTDCHGADDAGHGAGGVGTVSVVVARFVYVEAAGVGTTVDECMDGVVPVVVMVGSRAVPAAVLVFDGRVFPFVAGILSAHDHTDAGVAQAPHVVGIDFGQAPGTSVWRNAVGHFPGGVLRHTAEMQHGIVLHPRHFGHFGEAQYEIGPTF